MIHIIAILVFLIGMPTSLLFRVDLNKGKEDLFEWIINLASWFQSNLKDWLYILSFFAIYILLAIICYIKLINNYIKDDGYTVSIITVLNIPSLLLSPYSLLFYKKKR